MKLSERNGILQGEVYLPNGRYRFSLRKPLGANQIKDGKVIGPAAGLIEEYVNQVEQAIRGMDKKEITSFLDDLNQKQEPKTLRNWLEEFIFSAKESVQLQLRSALNHYETFRDIPLVDMEGLEGKQKVHAIRMTKNHFDEFRSYLESKGLAPKTVRAYLKSILLSFGALYETYGIRMYDKIDLPEDQPKEKLILSEEEIRNWLALGWADPIYKASCFQIKTMMRPGDLLSLRQDNFFPDGLRYQQQKTKKPIFIPIKEQVDVRGISYHKYKKGIQRIAKQLFDGEVTLLSAKGIPETKAKWEFMTPHILRSAGVIYHASKGMPEQMIRQIGGWALDSKVFREVYYKYSGEDVKNYF